MVNFFRYKKTCLLFIFAFFTVQTIHAEEDLADTIETIRATISSTNLSTRLKSQNLTLLKTQHKLIDENETIFLTCSYGQRANLATALQLLQNCVTQTLLDSETSTLRLTESSLSSGNLNIILLIPYGLLSEGSTATSILIVSLSNNVVKYLIINATTLALTVESEAAFVSN